ncbi:MAG: hypothetical protein AAGH65_02405, partial [Pseudomonadota bacterium]
MLLFGLAASASATVELSASLTGDSTYTPGESGTYTFTITNTGTTDESDLRVSTNFPVGAQVSNVAVTETGTGTSCNARVVGRNLDTTASDVDASNGACSYVLTVDFDSSLSVSPLVITGAIDTTDDTTPPTDPTQSRTIDREADLSVSITAPNSNYVPGDTDSFTVTVANDGPSDASGVDLTLSPPTGMTITGWTCAASSGSCPGVSGSGAINQTNLAIAAGVTFTYSINASFLASLTTSPLVVETDIDVPGLLGDPDTADQSDSISLTRNPQANLRVDFVNATVPSVYVPGTDDEVIRIGVDNLGPTDSTGATFVLVQDGAVSNQEWSCSPTIACTPSSGTGDINSSIDLDSGSAVIIELTLDFDSGARADLVLDPVITANNETDSTAGNNTDTQTIPAERRADVSVTKVASSVSVNPGGEFSYTIVVSNLGPSDLGPDPGDASTNDEQGVLLTDIFDPSLLGALSCSEDTSPCWTVCANDLGVTGDYTADVASCPTTPLEGSGDIGDVSSGISLALAAGSTTTLVADVRVPQGASGDIANTASVALFSGMDAQVIENTLGGGTDSDSVTIPVELSTDIAVTKTDGQTSAVAGEEHSYTIVVSNDGFATANNVEIDDVFPLFVEANFPGASQNAGYIDGSVQWSCSAFDGACCNTNSTSCGVDEPITAISNVLDQAVDLPGQSRVEFTVTGTLDPRASGTLSNTVTASLDNSTLDDSVPGNNSATDSDTVLVRAPALVVEKSQPIVTSVNADDAAPFRLVYEIQVSNEGLSYVPDIAVSDPLGTGFDAATASWTCAVLTPMGGDTACDEANGTGALSTTVDLEPGGQVVFELTVDTEDTVSGTVTNTASASGFGDVASDTVLTSLIGSARLTISKTDSQANLAPGEDIEYLIRVQNEGPNDVFNARVQDIFPSDIDSVVWSCSAETPVPGDLAQIDLVGQADTAGNDVLISQDGQHVYVIGSASDSLFAYDRTAVPGENFGNVVLLETEINGINDAGDPGPVVDGMNNPIALAISRDGRVIYVLSSDVDDGPSLAAFARNANPASASFGELTFLGSSPDGLPLVPTALAVTEDQVYVVGQGDPDLDPNTNDVLAIFMRDALTGLALPDFIRTVDVPMGVADVIADATDTYLFAGGDSLQMYTIDPAQNGLPAGRLTPVSSLLDPAQEIEVAGDAADLIVRSGAATTPALAVVQYLDMNGDPSLNERFNYAASAVTGVVGNAFAGNGGIALAPDGEHLIGVSESLNVMYSFRRDPTSGGLTFQEVLEADQPSAGGNRGLFGATALVVAPDGRHVLVAAAADTSSSNPPLTVLSRRAPDPLFALLETDTDDSEVPAGFETGITGLRSPNDLAVSSENSLGHVYAVSLADHSIVQFVRNPRLGLDDDSAGQHLQFQAVYVDGVNGVQGLTEPR